MTTPWSDYKSFQAHAKFRLDANFVVLDEELNFDSAGEPTGDYTHEFTNEEMAIQKRQNKALVTAQKQLEASQLFFLPDVRPELTYDGQTTQTEIKATETMKAALYEQALFILAHQKDFDGREGLIRQGVHQADVIGEVYADAYQIPICSTAMETLSPYLKKNKFFDLYPNEPERILTSTYYWPRYFR